MIINVSNATPAVEASGQSGKINPVSAAEGSSSAAKSSSFTEDTTSLKSASDSVQNLTATALVSDPARAARVESLKQAVAQGKYSIEPEHIASALSSAKI